MSFAQARTFHETGASGSALKRARHGASLSFTPFAGASNGAQVMDPVQYPTPGMNVPGIGEITPRPGFSLSNSLGTPLGARPANIQGQPSGRDQTVVVGRTVSNRVGGDIRTRFHPNSPVFLKYARDSSHKSTVTTVTIQQMLVELNRRPDKAKADWMPSLTDLQGRYVYDGVVASMDVMEAEDTNRAHGLRDASIGVVVRGKIDHNDYWATMPATEQAGQFLFHVFRLVPNEGDVRAKIIYQPSHGPTRVSVGEHRVNDSEGEPVDISADIEPPFVVCVGRSLSTMVPAVLHQGKAITEQRLVAAFNPGAHGEIASTDLDLICKSLGKKMIWHEQCHPLSRIPAADSSLFEEDIPPLSSELPRSGGAVPPVHGGQGAGGGVRSPGVTPAGSGGAPAVVSSPAVPGTSHMDVKGAIVRLKQKLSSMEKDLSLMHTLEIELEKLNSIATEPGGLTPETKARAKETAASYIKQANEAEKKLRLGADIFIEEANTINTPESDAIMDRAGIISTEARQYATLIAQRANVLNRLVDASAPASSTSPATDSKQDSSADPATASGSTPSNTSASGDIVRRAQPSGANKSKPAGKQKPPVQARPNE